MRTKIIKRYTNETKIELSLNVDGSGQAVAETGCGFLDHMLTLFSAHGKFDLDVKCAGDVNVDYHHTVEDVAICLGKAFSEALGDMRGITRYADITLPMDEALVLCAVDISGRAHLSCGLRFPTQKVGDFDTELVAEFLLAFVRSSHITLHIKQLDGSNSHHIAEACFKSLARALSSAAALNDAEKGRIPSTKGVL